MPAISDQAVALHPELGVVFVAGHIGCVDVLQVRTGDLVQRLSGLADTISGIATDGNSLVAASDVAGNVAVWNCRSGRRMWRALLPCVPSITAIAVGVDVARLPARSAAKILNNSAGFINFLIVASKTSVYGIDMKVSG